MKIIFGLFLSLLTLGTSCQREEASDMPSPSPSESATAPVPITIDLFEDGLETSATTRIIDHKPDDANVYIYCEALGYYHHSYLVRPNVSLSLYLPRGEYEIYVLGNFGRDIGDRTRTQIAAEYVEATTTSYFPPSAPERSAGRAAFSVTADTRTVDVRLERIFCKVEARITVGSALGTDARLVSVIPYNLPGRMNLFAENKLSTSQAQFTYPYKDLTSSNLRSYTLTYYQFENRQGERPSITSQKERTKHNAPAMASYLLIRVQAGDCFFDYIVFLGGNSTSNFDVIRNTAYTYDIEIVGSAASDLRISQTEIAFWGGYRKWKTRNVLQWDDDGYAYAEVEVHTQSADPKNELTISYATVEGTFKSKWTMEYTKSIDTTPAYTAWKPGTTLSLHKIGQGYSHLYLRFRNLDGNLEMNWQTMDNVFDFTIRDTKGFSRTYRLTMIK